MKRALLAFGLALFTTMPSFAAPSILNGQVMQQQPLQQPVRKAVLTGSEVQENELRVVNGLQWHNDLNSALQDAARQGKMVLWIHMLGDIKGAT
ncbi:MAG TPA: hypothetical protein V6C69_07710 [Trichormus sp.]|jgi:hypothetical protein